MVITSCANSDVGAPCPELQIPNSSTTLFETQEVVGQNAQYPCDDLICIASQGKGGYCSRKCQSNGACPTGFECRVIQSIGNYAGQGFCAWKACGTAEDCGNPDDFCCAVVNNSDPVHTLKLCGFAQKGRCL